MSCLVRLYEESGTPVSHIDLTSGSIDLVAVDQATGSIYAGTVGNSPLVTGGYGADLTFSQSAMVYQIAIADNGRTYSGATIQNLSGSKQGDIDVVLFKLPPPGLTATLQQASSAAQVRTFVQSISAWSQSQRLAVLNTADALSSLRGPQGKSINDLIRILERALQSFGIDPSLF